MVLSVAKLFRPLIESKGVRFNVRCDFPEDMLVLSDENRLRQVLVNLLGNSLKFTDQGSIGLSVKRGAEPEILIFEVSDTGIGMSLQTLESLFQPFEQGRSESERGRGGTGLGLTISRKLCELMGGTVTAQSALREGTTFTASISAPQQRSEERPHLVAAVRGVQEAFTLPSTVKILLVEDNEANAFLMKRLIAKWGGAVVHAKNGQEAVELAQSTPFDIILMDCQMPVMDGFEATRAIRAGEGKSKATPIIALTANAFGEYQKICEDAGMNDFVTKPIDVGQLTKCLQGYLPPSSKMTT
jgi:CheY-like chemotaxis protein